ncbi:hypothetical protein AB0J14_04970 [Micromonospora arborensis]|uniref:hypothetical protein n=1 Tax=Micromonospora arborensis TaxID=2116518 RepID=UPI0033CED230
MTDQIRAADLPDGSVVSGERTTYIKDHPSKTAAWRGTRGGHHRDWEVDEALTAGAQVLRVGSEPSGEMEHLRVEVAEMRAALEGPVPATPAPNARERLARHLWLESRPNDPYAAAHWQAGDSFVNKEPWRRKADAALAVITRQGN